MNNLNALFVGLSFVFVSALCGAIGGFVVFSLMKEEAIPAVSELNTYEKELKKIGVLRDSVRTSVPSRQIAWDYIFDRYDTAGIPKPY